MGTIRFEIRKEKEDKDGLVPIRMIYQVQGQRKYYSTGEKLPEDNWSENEQQAVYVKRVKLLDIDIKKINSELQTLILKIEKIENRFTHNDIAYSASMVIDELNQLDKPTTKRDASSKELFAFIDTYIDDHKLSKVKGSLSVYKSLRSHLEGYENKTGLKVSFDKIDRSFFQAFQNYLLGTTKKEKDGRTIKKDKDGKPMKALNDITIAKQLSTLKTFLNYAKDSGISVTGSYGGFKIKRDNDLEIIALTQGEHRALMGLDLTGRPAWGQVRDVFCFSCATGLRYSDLKQLRREHIKGDVIDLKTIKTSHKSLIPLNSDAKAILQKYAGEPRPLPVISNQKSNEHLANICKLAGIDTPVEIVRNYGKDRVANFYPKYELIRMHCGRKSFATINAERGMRAEVIMKIGGWKDWKSFKRYINVTDESAKEAMTLAYSNASPSKLKAI